MSQLNEIICKECGKEAKIISFPEDCGEYEVYCEQCNIYLDEDGNIIDKIICKECGKEAKLISFPEDCGEYEIYCESCEEYLDEEGNIIKL